MENRKPAPKPEPWRICPKCLAYQSPDISPLGLCFMCATNLVTAEKGK